MGELENPQSRQCEKHWRDFFVRALGAIRETNKTTEGLWFLRGTSSVASLVTDKGRDLANVNQVF